MRIKKANIFNRKKLLRFVAIPLALVSTQLMALTPLLEKEIKISDKGLYFNGDKKASTARAESEPDVGPHQYDFMYGRAINPHGDCIKTYKHFVFMTWYRGGKQDRKLMLTRYNTITGSSKTIEFPHRHTGYSNRWWVGETHNTISLGLSPKNESIHMVFDQHSLSPTNPTDGSSANDYFRYYYSKPNALMVPDEEFTLDLFVKDDYFEGNDPINPYDNPNNETDEYKHITLTGEVNSSKFASLTYPTFFTNNEGDLFLYFRKGRSKNGRYAYIRYDGTKWDPNFRDFNYSQAQSRGNEYNYGVYGSWKFVGGKIRVGFQQRANKADRYLYQNGFFGAYSNDSHGKTDWYNYKDETIQTPILGTDQVKVAEPGDFVTGNERDRFSIVGGFDWNVTERGDVHFIGSITDTITKKKTHVHTYRKAGDTEFTSTSNFGGGDKLYTAGDNIYMIGLKNGRPFIDQTEGGTNKFERIYMQAEGRLFEKGVPYISDGKLYYYLLEQASGDARPLYLQIIDLNLDGSTQPTNNPPAGFNFAVNENELLTVDRPVDIAFGAQNDFLFFTNRRSDVTCANSMCTKDPIPDVEKVCYTREAKTTYSETYHPIPGTVEAEHYDYGGQNVSYFDTSPEQNKGAEESSFRESEGVDLAAGNGGVVIGWTGDGEWVEYSIYVHRAGDYDLQLITSSEAGDGSLSIHLDGESLWNSINVPATGDWAQYQATTRTVTLPEGQHVLRIIFDKGGFNLDKVTFEEVAQ